jgi:tRNA(fMet)-specific endonuclease VapC
VLYELWYGVARRARRRENAERLRVFLSGGIAVSPFTGDDARTAGDLRAALEAAGTPIGPYDLLIAAQGSVAAPRS